MMKFFLKKEKSKIFITFIVLLFIFFLPQIILAASPISFQQQIEVPGFESGEIQENSIAKYISAFYKWSVIAIAVFAVLMIVNAGFGMILAGGNAAKVVEKRNDLFQAIIGLMLALIAVPMLTMINPALTRISNLLIPSIEREEMPTGISDSSEIYLIAPGAPLLENASEGTLSIFDARRFCLYSPNGQLDNKSGTMEYVGGPRSFVAVIYFQDNKKHENVVIKGNWFLRGGQYKYSLCAREDGCGNRQDGWSAREADNLDQNECSLSNLEAPCSKIVLIKRLNALGWEGSGDLGDPGAETRVAGQFSYEIEVLSRKEKPEFESIKDSGTFTQTCGFRVPQCKLNSGVDKCCKKKVIPNSTQSEAYYYEFCTASNTFCPPEYEEEQNKIYCGI